MRMPIRQRKGSVRDKAPTPAHPPALPSQPASRQSSPTAFSRYFSASFFFRTLATEPSIRSSRFSIAMSYASALSGWAGSRRPRAWARCWVPCSRSACRRTWSTLKRCSWRSCPWAWEVCSMWGRRTWAWPSSARSPWALLGVSSTRSTTPLCKRRLRSSSLVASIRSWALAICSLAWPLWQLPRGWRQHLAYNGHSWGQAWS